MPSRCGFFPAILAFFALVFVPLQTCWAEPSSLPAAEVKKELAKPAPGKPVSGKPAPGKQELGKADSAVKRSPHKQSRHGDAKSMGAELGKQGWFLGKSGQGPRGDVWERGVPGQTLARKRTPDNRVDTQGGIDKALQSLSDYDRGVPETQSEADKGKRPGLRGQVSTESSTWRNPVTQPVRVDQEMPVSRRNVVGAYADVIRDESLHVTVGPELSLDAESSSGRHTSQHQNEPNTLGLGMKFQWDF